MKSTISILFRSLRVLRVLRVLRGFVHGRTYFASAGAQEREYF